MTKFLNISTDTTLGGSSASDDTVSSQKAIKTYVDSQTGTVPTFANITGQPSDNANLASVLNAKADTSLSNITSTAQENLVDLLFPVGSCYTTTASTCPLASIKGTWVQETSRVLVDKYQSGTDWWELYSDGWCRQGGANTNDSNVLVTLHKAYKDTNYSVMGVPASNNSKNSGYSCGIGSRTETQFNMSCSNNTTGNSTNFWVAEGYTSTTTGHKRFRRTAQEKINGQFISRKQ